MPPAAEIKAVIAGISGVNLARAELVKPPKTFSFAKGISRDPDFCQYFITGRDSFTALTLGKEKLKEIAFNSNWLNRVPTEVELVRATALMDTVYAAILTRYPWLPPKDKFTEIREMPNQSTDPTLAAGTPLAGPESRHP
jgi:hypothetical protein